MQVHRIERRKCGWAYRLGVLRVKGRYPPNPTIIMCDSTSAIGIATDTINQKQSKAIDMRFHWIQDRDRVRQSQFTIAYILPTSQNLADYFTKNLAYVQTEQLANNQNLLLKLLSKISMSTESKFQMFSFVLTSCLLLFHNLD